MQLSELPSTWKVLCFQSAVRVDNHSCQSYQIPVNLRVDVPYMVTVESRKCLELPQNPSNIFSSQSKS